MKSLPSRRFARFGIEKSAGRRAFTAQLTTVDATTSTLTTSSFAGASGTWTYTARDAGGSPVSGVPVTFTVDAEALVSASLSTVSASPGTIENDGVDAATMTTVVTDTDGDAVVNLPAASVVEASTGSNNTLTGVDSATNVSGAITTTLTSTTAETKTLSATVMGLAITDTATVVVSGAPASSYPNEPLGFTTIGEWNNAVSLTSGGFAPDGTPFRSLDSSSGSLGSITTTTSAIVAAAGSWTTAGLLDPATDPDNTPQYIRLANQDAGNNGRWLLVTSISGTTLNVSAIDGSPLVANSTPDSDWTATAGWGEYGVVSSGYAGTPTIGGANVMQRFYPAGADGGHDAGRITITLDSSKSEVFFGAEVQFANDSTTSTSLGGNKQLFIQTNGGSERIFSNFSATEAWNVYIGSTALTATYTASTAVTYADWITQEFYCAKPSGADNDGIIRVYIDGSLAWEKTNCSVGGGTFPSGNFFSAYLDMSNNGNRYPTGADPRRIGVNAGAAASSTAWCANLYVSQPT